MTYLFHSSPGKKTTSHILLHWFARMLLRFFFCLVSLFLTSKLLRPLFLPKKCHDAGPNSPCCPPPCRHASSRRQPEPPPTGEPLPATSWRRRWRRRWASRTESQHEQVVAWQAAQPGESCLPPDGRWLGTGRNGDEDGFLWGANSESWKELIFCPRWWTCLWPIGQCNDPFHMHEGMEDMCQRLTSTFFNMFFLNPKGLFERVLRMDTVVRSQGQPSHPRVPKGSLAPLATIPSINPWTELSFLILFNIHGYWFWKCFKTHDQLHRFDWFMAVFTEDIALHRGAPVAAVATAAAAAATVAGTTAETSVAQIPRRRPSKRSESLHQPCGVPTSPKSPRTACDSWGMVMMGHGSGTSGNNWVPG